MADKKKEDKKEEVLESEKKDIRSRLTEFEEWLQKLDSQSFCEWERLPDIDLYMDQVLTMMERQLHLYLRSSDDKPLTQSMINNYTKDGILPRAVDKKYSRSHLALLSVLAALKPILSISELRVLLSSLSESESERNTYETFLDTQNRALTEVKDQTLQWLNPIAKEEDDDTAASDATSGLALNTRDTTEKYEKDTENKAAVIALRLCVDARIRQLIAQGILNMIDGKEI